MMRRRRRREAGKKMNKTKANSNRLEIESQSYIISRSSIIFVLSKLKLCLFSLFHSQKEILNSEMFSDAKTIDIAKLLCNAEFSKR